MTIALVQTSAVRKFSSSRTPAALSLPSVVAGNSIILLLFAVEFSATSPTCSVSDGSAYTATKKQAYSAGGSEKWVAEIHHIHNSSGGTKSIAVTAAASTTPYGQIIATEWSGLANASALSSAGAGASTAAPGTGTLAAAGSTERVALAILGCGAASAAGIDLPTNWTNIYLDNSTAENPGSMDRRIYTGSGDPGASWGTLDSARHTVCAGVVFEAAAASGTAVRLFQHYQQG